MNNKTDFIIIGAAILDILAQPAGPEIFIKGSYPAEHITMNTGGDAMNESTVLSSLGASVRLVTKLGNDSAGSFIFNHCQKHLIDTTFSTIDDSTGAGDTFTACFIYAFNQGMSLEECGRFANAGASICIEHIGATGTITNVEQIWERYDKLTKNH